MSMEFEFRANVRTKVGDISEFNFDSETTERINRFVTTIKADCKISLEIYKARLHSFLSEGEGAGVFQDKLKPLNPVSQYMLLLPRLAPDDAVFFQNVFSTEPVGEFLEIKDDVLNMIDCMVGDIEMISGSFQPVQR